MAQIIREIGAWATGLPYWEQAALAMILEGKPLDDEAYERLAHYLLQDANLEETDASRPALRFDLAEAPGDEPRPSERHLKKLCNLKNINALVPGQTLTFGPQLTLVYGENGSGKSGYARVLACAGFCRGNREVLPDVTQPVAGNAVRSATLHVSDRGDPIEYVIDGPCTPLSTFYVFDSASVLQHLAKQHALSFSPAGLSYLTELADVTDDVRRRLRMQIADRSKPHDFGALFQGVSEMSKSIASLGTNADLQALRCQAVVDPADQERLAALDRDIAKLKSQDVAQQVAGLRQAAADLGGLAERLRGIERALSEYVLDAIKAAIKDYQALRIQAAATGVEQFKSQRFTQVGSRIWHEFLQAAKALADAEQTPDHPYPDAHDPCLLCRQPLSPEARDLLVRLWSFLESEAQVRLDSAAAALNRTRDDLISMAFEFVAPESPAHRELKGRDEGLLELVTDFVAACRLLRDAARGMVEAREIGALPPLPSSPVSAIEALVERLNQGRLEIERANPSLEIAKLAEERLALQHRMTLQRHLPEIETYVRGLIWCGKAEKALGDTKHITRKHNELFQRLIADDYVERFQTVLADFGRPLRVTVQTIPRKGETLKQIVLQTSPSADARKVTPDRVLSDGEKQAVALADFLTEASLDEECIGILMDDPSGFLDLRWQDCIAARLAAEAQRRQVVVLTNDLVFLHKLSKAGEKQQVDAVTHWIKRGDVDDRPGYVYLDNSPACEHDYKTSKLPRQWREKAMNCQPAEQQYFLEQGFAALRTCYEAFIIFGLFNGAVRRFEEPIGISNLKGLVWDTSIADTVVEKHRSLSRFIESHLHSDVGYEMPTPKTLMLEIEAFDELSKKHKALQPAH